MSKILEYLNKFKIISFAEDKKSGPVLCLKCEAELFRRTAYAYCPNKVCDRYGLLTQLAIREHSKITAMRERIKNG